MCSSDLTVPRPMGLVMSPDGKQLYASLGRARSIAIVDVAGRKFVRTIEDVGTRPWGLAVSADGRKLYTANGPSNDVTVVDAEKLQIIRKIPVGKIPWGVAIGGAPGPEQ